MSLQSTTIQRYRLFYPSHTLREISAQTGIQITRVFRLINGRKMRVEELEAFEKAINDKLSANPSMARLNSSIEEASSFLTNDELARLADYIERKVANKKYSKICIRPIFQNADIA